MDSPNEHCKLKTPSVKSTASCSATTETTTVEHLTSCSSGESEYVYETILSSDSEVEEYFAQSVYEYFMTYNKKTNTGEKTVYRCKFWAEFGEQCEECLYLYKSKNGITIHRSNAYFHHNHGKNIDPQIMIALNCFANINTDNSTWIFVREFYFRDHVEEYVLRRKNWILLFNSTKKYGSQEVYSCKFRNQAGYSCKAEYKVVYTFVNVFAVFIGNIEHTHVNDVNISNQLNTSNEDAISWDEKIKSEPINDEDTHKTLKNFENYLESNGFTNFAILRSDVKHNKIVCNYFDINGKRCGAEIVFSYMINSKYQINLERNPIQHCHQYHVKQRKSEYCHKLLTDHYLEFQKFTEKSDKKCTQMLTKSTTEIPKSIQNDKIDDLNYETEMKRLYLLGFKIKFMYQMFAEICTLQETSFPIPNDETFHRIINNLEPLDQPDGKRQKYWSRIAYNHLPDKSQHSNNINAWSLVKTYDNIFEVEDWLETANMWKFHSGYVEKTGYVHFFRCDTNSIAKNRKITSQCHAEIGFIFNCTKDVIVLVQNLQLHSNHCTHYAIIWKKELSFTSHEDVRLYLLNNPKWTKIKNHITPENDICYYQCNISRDCPVRLMMNYEISGDISMHTNNAEHYHLLKKHNNNVLKLTLNYDELKTEIRNLYYLGLSSKSINAFLLQCKKYDMLLENVKLQQFIDNVIAITILTAGNTDRELKYKQYHLRINKNFQLKTCSCPNFEKIKVTTEANVHWILCETHTSIEDVEDFLTLNNMWIFNHEVEVNDQLQHHFKCCNKIVDSDEDCKLLLNIVFFGK